MLAALAWLRRARDWAWAIGAVVVGVGLLILRDRWRGQGRREAEQEARDDAADRIDAGREAVRDGRAGGGSPDERMRANDSRW